MDSRAYQCRTNPDCFCYMCAKYIFGQGGREINEDIKEVYEKYFGIPICNQDKNGVPHKICNTCRSNLSNYKNGTLGAFPFGIPAIWREPFDHMKDCYFCVTKTRLVTKDSIVYPTVASLSQPIKHDENILPPSPYQRKNPSLSEFIGPATPSGASSGEIASVEEDPNAVKLFTQDQVSDMIRKMGLTIDNSEYLASTLKNHNVCEKGNILLVVL